MQLERLGVIVFFGIIVPGAFLTASILLAFACLLEVNGIRGHAEIFSLISKSLVLSTTAFFFLSYLLGVVLRLFAPSKVDKSSAFFLDRTRNLKWKLKALGKWFFSKRKQKWKLKAIRKWFFRAKKAVNHRNADHLDEDFPYLKGLESRLKKHGMGEVITFIEGLNKDYGKRDNTTFFTYCKLLIEANNENLAKHIQQSEAMVRFLSGTAFALLISAVLGAVFSLIFLRQHKTPFFLSYACVSAVSLATLAGILWRFRYQRRREVMLVWVSLYLLLKGGIPNTLGSSSPDELTKRIRLNSPGKPSHLESPSSVQSDEPAPQAVTDLSPSNKELKEHSESEAMQAELAVVSDTFTEEVK